MSPSTVPFSQLSQLLSPCLNCPRVSTNERLPPFNVLSLQHLHLTPLVRSYLEMSLLQSRPGSSSRSTPTEEIFSDDLSQPLGVGGQQGEGQGEGGESPALVAAHARRFCKAIVRKIDALFR